MKVFSTKCSFPDGQQSFLPRKFLCKDNLGPSSHPQLYSIILSSLIITVSHISWGYQFHFSCRKQKSQIILSQPPTSSACITTSFTFCPASIDNCTSFGNSHWTGGSNGLFNTSSIGDGSCSVRASVDQTPVRTICSIINILSVYIPFR